MKKSDTSQPGRLRVVFRCCVTWPDNATLNVNREAVLPFPPTAGMSYGFGPDSDFDCCDFDAKRVMWNDALGLFAVDFYDVFEGDEEGFRRTAGCLADEGWLIDLPPMVGDGPPGRDEFVVHMDGERYLADRWDLVYLGLSRPAGSFEVIAGE